MPHYSTGDCRSIGPAFTVDLGTDPRGPIGPFTLENDEVLDLYAVRLSPGLLNLRLVPQDGNADLGLAVMALQAFTSKADVHLDALAIARGAGEVEEFNVRIAHEDLYAIAVFKQSSADTFHQERYVLEFDNDATTTPPGMVSSLFELAPASPNPFATRTTLQWSLRRDAHLRLDVYDARGRLVRTLVDAMTGPGDQVLVWDGQDETGRLVGQGLYFLRADVEGVTRGQKVLVVR